MLNKFIFAQTNISNMKKLFTTFLFFIALFAFSKISAQGPMLTNAIPSANSSNTFINITVTLFFDAPIKQNTFQYTCSPDPGGWVATWFGDDKVVGLNHNDFLYGKTYTFTVVAAKDTNGNSMVANPNVPSTWTFETQPNPAGIDDNPAEISSVYPNPFSGKLTNSVQNPKGQTISIQLFNSIGQLVKQISNQGNTFAGLNVFTFDTENLPAGMYFCHTRVGENLEIQKLVCTN